MIVYHDGTRCELVEDGVVNWQKSPRVTLRLAEGDVYTRKKGYGWQRRITDLVWIGERLMIGFEEHYGDYKWKGKDMYNCTANALVNWGKKE